MQNTFIRRLNASCFDLSLLNAWQLFKHQAHREGRLPSLHFNATRFPTYCAGDVVQLGINEMKGPFVEVALPGFSGVSSAVPRMIYKEALEAHCINSDDAALDFFDIFDNRYYRLYCQTEQTFQLGSRLEESTFEWNQSKVSVTDLLSCLTGSQSESADLPRMHLVQYIPFLGCILAPPSFLKSMLEDYFSMPFDIQSNALEYQLISKNAQTRLGISGENQRLGLGSLLGRKIPIYGQKLKIFLFPPSYEAYLDVRQNFKMFCVLNDLVRRFIGVSVKFTFHMKVNSHYLPRVQLSANPKRAQRLGLSTWMSLNSNGAVDQNEFVEMPLIVNEVVK